MPAGVNREAPSFRDGELVTYVLLLLAKVHGCALLSMESLKALKATGRGRGVRGRWRNYRNNTTIRGAIW